MDSQLDSPDPGSSRQPDEFEKVQKELKTLYWGNMKRIHPLTMCEWEEQDLEHVFTNLQVVEGKKSRLSGSFKEQSSRPTNDPELIDRIFNPPGRNICFIEGPAGIGKSTLCRQFAYLWSKDGYKIHGHHFELVGILEARNLTKDFRKSFVQELFPEDFQISKDEICQHFQKGKSLLIIDGADELTADGEWAITQLLEGRFFRNVHLIITGRPESAKKFIGYAKLHLEVTGFSVRNAEKYICKYFRNGDSYCEEVLLVRLEDDGELCELMVNPFVTLLLCILVQEMGEIPSNRSEIYHEVMWTICRKYVMKLQEQGDYSLDEEMLYNAACYVAYTGVRYNVFVFSENDLNSLCGGDLGFHLLNSGILSEDYTISRLHSIGFCYFPHRSFQEFLGGSYLEKMDLEEFKKEVLPLLPNKAVSPFRHSILACLTYLPSTQANQQAKIVLDHLFEIVAQDKTLSLTSLCRWILETVNFLFLFLVDLVDVLRIHCNGSFKVALVLCAGFASEEYNFDPGKLVQFAILKMDFPPVTYICDVEAMCPLGKISDFRVTVYNETEWDYLRLENTLLLTFQNSNGPKMSFIHCVDIRDASACLQKLRRLGVLTITVTPHQINYFHLKAFQQDLTSVENKINIVFVFLEDRYDDSLFPNFISLVKGYTSDKVKMQVITLKPFERWMYGDPGFVFIRPLIAYDRKYDTEVTKYKLPERLHRECYDRFCPY